MRICGRPGGNPTEDPSRRHRQDLALQSLRMEQSAAYRQKGFKAIERHVLPIRRRSESDRQPGTSGRVRRDARTLDASTADKLTRPAAIVDRLMIALLTGGHVLIESMPGLVKTRSMRRLGSSAALRASSALRISCGGRHRHPYVPADQRADGFPARGDAEPAGAGEHFSAARGTVGPVPDALPLELPGKDDELAVLDPVGPAAAAKGRAAQDSLLGFADGLFVNRRPILARYRRAIPPECGDEGLSRHSRSCCEGEADNGHRRFSKRQRSFPVSTISQ